MSDAGPARSRLASGTTVVVAVAAVLVVGGVAATAARGILGGGSALAFGALVAVGELVRITLPGDRVQAPLGLAGALGYAFLYRLPSETLQLPVAQVVAVTATGMLVGTLPHLAVGRAPALDVVARRTIVVAFAAAVARPLLTGPLEHQPDVRAVIVPLVLSAVAVAALLLDGLLAAVIVVDRQHVPFRAALRNELRAMVGMGAAVGATGVLLAQAAAVMGLWAIPVLSVPLLATQLSFRRYAAIRATYLQTIRALSRVTEIGGYTETGHARRVSRLAVAVGRDLGMTEEELRDLEYAALMHDIGQLSLTDPIPGGATLMVPAEERRRIADLGGAVIRQTGVLDGVAVLVEDQARPYRTAGSESVAEPPLGARIIRVVNAFDDLVGEAVEAERAADGLARLGLETAYEYDPAVVESLARVLRRRTA